MEDLIKKIPHRLKTLRKAKGWSLDTASKNTNVSKAMLGQIERGESCPTIAVLWKIAAGFKVAFSTFLEEGQDHTTYHRSGEPKQILPNDSKILVTPIFPYDKKLGFETFIIKLLPGCNHLSSPHQEGVVEHIVVTQGTMEVLVNGIWHRLKENEGLRFDANTPHGYRNTSVLNATILDIIHY